MIQITDKEKCCGCGACAQACPVNCITMVADEEGFLYPHVDANVCINCGKCEKICPAINQTQPSEPIACYAAKNPNEEIRLKSSSGGIFSMLAERTINNGGIVFGARFDGSWQVVHDQAETIEGLNAFRGSKYVQSDMSDCFARAKRLLDSGREVLFSGTPCQIAGLKKYLGKEYPNLLAVDIICHGIPSPLVWQNYIETVKKSKGGKNSAFSHSDNAGNAKIDFISFRDKQKGWKKYSLALRLTKATAAGEQNTAWLSAIHHNDPFMRSFLQDLILRPSCYACASKSGKSGSDITIADFWGIENIRPDFDDDKGVSLVIVNSEKGTEYFESINTEKTTCSIDDATKCNPSYYHSVKCPKHRDYFFKKIRQSDCETILNKIAKKNLPPIWRRIASRIKRVILKPLT